MDLRAAETYLESYRVTLGKLRAARKAVAAGPAEAVAGIDAALAAFEGGAMELAEEIASTDWWLQTDVPALANLIPGMAALVGVAEGGPVARLAENIGRICRPRSA